MRFLRILMIYLLFQYSQIVELLYIDWSDIWNYLENVPIQTKFAQTCLQVFPCEAKKKKQVSRVM